MKHIPFTVRNEPTQLEFEYEYCCGTTCSQPKVALEFKELQAKCVATRNTLASAMDALTESNNKLDAIQEVVDEHDKTNLEYYRREGVPTTGYSVQVIGKIAAILT